MSIQNYVVLTFAQLSEAQTLDDDENYQIGTRAVDAVSPGIGTNNNPFATAYEIDDVVTLTNMYVAPQRIIDDPDCATYCEDLAEYLSDLPWCVLDSDEIFAPVEYDGA